jgi:transposase-like protein
MDLHLTHNPPAQYKSRSQISKSLTERWFSENMYCPACPSESLEQTPPNEKVVDFVCPKCEEKYQLKGMAHDPS